MLDIRNIKSIKKIDNNTTITVKSTNVFAEQMRKETSYGLTENGALTFKDSMSALLNLYAQAGSMRNEPDKALDLFKKAFSEDRLSAIKILFYLRDVRGGQGERNLFRVCLQYLGENEPKIFEKIVEYVSEYGRWDDLFFDNEKCFTIIDRQLHADKNSDAPSLLAKWMPTINSGNANTKAKARFIAEKIGMKEVVYRKLIRGIRAKIATVEEKMSARQWGDINYSTVPSQASRIYRNSFKKHDEKRYGEFIDKAEKGEVKINASTLYPYQIYDAVYKDYSQTLEALWNQLPDYTQGKNAIVVADTSASMDGQPMSVSVSLALYFAERNKGQFKDYFISFSEKPKLHKVNGINLRDKMNSITLGDVANTNLQAVFELILNTALSNNTPSEELPATIYIISDMEFDECTRGKTNFEDIKSKYDEVGYSMPSIVFWNVNASGSNLPVQKNEQGVALVSGFSPVIFKIAVENKTPEEIMFETINSERYAKIII